jgi:hypothetical protein
MFPALVAIIPVKMNNNYVRHDAGIERLTYRRSTHMHTRARSVNMTRDSKRIASVVLGLETATAPRYVELPTGTTEHFGNHDRRRESFSLRVDPIHSKHQVHNATANSEHNNRVSPDLSGLDRKPGGSEHSV